MRGLTAFPGLIDLHGDMLEREIEPRPGARFPVDMALLELDKRLAAAGVTTAYAAISFWNEARRHVRSEEVLRDIVAAVNGWRDSLLVDFYIHARYEVTTPDMAAAMAAVIASDQVHLVSLMDHTPGQGQYRDLEQYFDFMTEWRKTTRSEVIREYEKRLQRISGTPSIWPTAHEIARMAVDRGLPLASHDDDTPAKVRLVACMGASISEFPVTLVAAHEARRHGMRVMMGAPNALRGISTSGNLSAREAIQSGVVDGLASDYHPATLLHASIAVAQAGLLSLPEAAKLVSHHPAAAAGLSDRGSIAVGKSADVALVEMAGCSRVRATLRRGVPIYWDRYMASLGDERLNTIAEQRTPHPV
jgi:alpha-D-ribose 1-methylphosphonate 5-triphosphate diphosphatase